MKFNSNAKNSASNAILKVTFAIALLVAFVSSTARAHPGHGIAQDNSWSALHFLGSLQHSSVIALGLALAAFVGYKLYQLRRNARNSAKQS